MKCVMMAAAVAVAIPVSISIPSPASAQLTPSTGLVEDCKDFRYAGRTLGECVSTRTVRDALGVPGAAPLQCDLLQDVAPDFFYANWDSYEECVRDLSTDFRSSEGG